MKKKMIVLKTHIIKELTIKPDNNVMDLISFWRFLIILTNNNHICNVISRITLNFLSNKIVCLN